MAQQSAGRAVPPPSEVAPGQAKGLGTFGGVFTPSILTILGVIMYLRFGWVVGNVGLLGSLLIVTISTAITFLTALSIAAIATDQQVRIGGAYYMISRSLETILHESSAGADLVLLGMAEPNGDYVSYYESLRERTTGLPSIAYVLAAEPIAFEDVLL